MADVTPTAAISGGKAVFTFGSNTYHGVTNYRLSSSISSQLVEFSSSTGATSLTIAGGPTDTMSFDIVLGAGDATTPAALKRGTENATCTLHPEGDAAGNIEIIFESGLITGSELGGAINSAAILSLTVQCNGDLTIQDAT